MKFTLSSKTFLLSLTFLSLALASCFPDNSSVYDGPLQVEFRPTSDSQSMADGDTYEANIQLIGPHQDADITVDFEVDAENSTAVAGQHFELSGNSFTIPANSSFGTITITGIPQNIGASKPVVAITLLGGTEGKVTAAENYKSLELTLEP